MFDIAPSELLLVAVVALVVIGPKDLPRAMRLVGRWVGKARGMARHFRSGFDEMVRQAELEEMEKRWATENARIMAEHPSPPPEEAHDAEAAFGRAVPHEGMHPEASEPAIETPHPPAPLPAIEATSHAATAPVSPADELAAVEPPARPVPEEGEK